ncbi:hypothetical protein AVEN_193291-1 [Araneus ventricosus]|uniref:Uncharacterized protein n=1 Tax=Araneus ventricosus TaxID=182803 RepID=A0A4Y2RXC0_ARAVE|nr:hypothetical protein AVEN_193291-1 [Araneus ventricosus]
MIGSPSYKSKNSIILSKLLKKYDARREQKNRAQTTTDHGNRSRRFVLASLMFELFTATMRETTDAHTSTRATTNIPVPTIGNNAHRRRNLWFI